MAPHRWTIDDVLARTDLARLLDQVAQPAGATARGRRWHCPVPDHADANASVTMFTDGRGHERWRCWSGDDHHRGDAIDLVCATSRATRAEAINELAQRAGLRIGEPPPPVPSKARPPSRSQGPTALDPCVARYSQACEQILSTNTGRPVREWLEQRGLQPEVIKANHVGADPGRALLRRQRGLPYGGTLAATFPALDPSGAVRYLQTRYLDPGDGPKYDNPAGHLGSNPRVAWTVPVGEPHDEALVVCEGIPDALTAAQAGFRSVAVLGSQYPDERVGCRLATFAERLQLPIVAVVDADDAGRQWGSRLQLHVGAANGGVSLVEPPEAGLDLNDWAIRDPSWPTVVCEAGRGRQLTQPVVQVPSIEVPAVSR